MSTGTVGTAEQRRGKVTFVGAGCGDPRLLTVRGAEVLATADLVLFDPEVHPDVLAHVRAGTERIPIRASMPAQQVGMMLVDEARAGRHVVRVAFSDPMLFGTGDVEASEVVRHDIPLEVVPGITAFVAVGAFAGSPLTRSTDALASVTLLRVTVGQEALHDWAKVATATDTLAITCDAASVAEVARRLALSGRSGLAPVLVVENVSLPSQSVVESTLNELSRLPPPSARVLLVVGEHARRVPGLDWLEEKPLFGLRVLVTRAGPQAQRTLATFRESGADPLSVPMIEVQPPSDPSALVEVVSKLTNYGWVAFTSANGVEQTFAEMARQGRDARAFGFARIAAIGPGTASALVEAGVFADLIAKESRGEGLAAALLERMGAERPRVLVARAEVAREALPEGLRAAGCEVDTVAAYRTHPAPGALLEGVGALLEAGELDVVTLTSSSTVEHLCDGLGERAPQLLARACVACISPVTTRAAEKRGIRVDVTASVHTLPGLVSALEAHFMR